MLRPLLCIGLLSLHLSGEPVPAEDAEPADDAVEIVEPAGTPIPPAARSRYFGSSGSAVLIDPQGFLNSAERTALTEQLRRHGVNSRIAIRVMLFAGDQRMPDEAAALTQSILRREKRPTALVHFFMTEPERSRLYLGPDLEGRLREGEAELVAFQTGRDARKGNTPVEQLDEFCAQLSIRLYWIERSLGWVDEVEEVREEMTSEALALAAGGNSVVEKLKSSVAGAWAHSGLVLALLGAAFASLLGAHLWLRSRRTCEFPQFDVPPRLGGEHAAGIGAVISFGSLTLSPSSQREKAVDSLGGV